MIKRAPILILLLAMLVSGCITVRVETNIKKDGSGTKSFVLALDKSVTSMFESMAQEAGASTDDIWSTMRASADMINGAKVEEYSDDKAEGIKVTVPFNELEELEALSGSDAFEGADVVTVDQDGDTKTLRATVDVSEFTSGLGEAGGEALEGFDLLDIEIDYSYAVEVEGEILEYSPQDFATLEGSRVTWDLTQASGDTVELMVKWESGGGFNFLVVVLIVLALGGLALLTVGVILALRTRRTVDQTDVA